MKEKYFVLLLTIIVSISGLSQGMLLPLIAFLFEERNVPSHINGLHATSLYIGIFAVSFFLEGWVRKFGYKRLIIAGALLVGIALLLFPVLPYMSIWFVLRLIVGVGDNMLHFSTQSWLTQVVRRDRLGRILSIYGLSFSLGFMIGPLIARLVTFYEPLPFIISAVLTMGTFLLIMKLKNVYPVGDTETVTFRSTFSNFNRVMKTSWIAFLFPLTFGVMESALNSNFPVFALKNHLTLSDITWILPSFSLGTIILQVPLGSLSDKVPRMLLMSIVTLLGGLLFLLADVYSSSQLILMVIFFCAGMFSGSLYSLGLSLMTEITPQQLLPAGNLMCNIAFSLGSISGPILGGFVIHFSHNQYFFTMLSVMLILCSIITFYYQHRHNKNVPI